MNFIMSRLSRKSFWITLFRYGLVGLGVILVQEGRLDPAQWETIVGAVMTIVTALFGGSDSTVSKVVSDGRSVALKNLSDPVRQSIESQIDLKPSRSWLDIFIGK